MKKFIISAIVLMASALSLSAHAGFASVETCKSAAATGKVTGYEPVTNAEFKGGAGWELRTVGAGGACLANPYVREEGHDKKVASIFVAEGFKYWYNPATGAYRMHKCSNPFDGLVSVASSTAVAQAPLAVNSPQIPVIAQVSGGMPMMPRFPELDKVYSDAEGNTFERSYGGSRECILKANGDIVKRYFVQHPNQIESKRQCDLLKADFFATMTPTTPEGKVSQTISYQQPVALAAPISYQYQQPTPAAAIVTEVKTEAVVIDMSIPCNLMFNGKVAETTKTVDDAACHAWTKERAKQRGWIPAPTM